jgi:hypothetical protein
MPRQQVLEQLRLLLQLTALRRTLLQLLLLEMLVQLAAVVVQHKQQQVQRQQHLGPPWMQT